MTLKQFDWNGLSYIASTEVKNSYPLPSHHVDNQARSYLYLHNAPSPVRLLNLPIEQEKIKNVNDFLPEKKNRFDFQTRKFATAYLNEC